MSSSALNARTVNAIWAPAKVRERVARLVGSMRTTATKVWFGRAGAAGRAWSPGAAGAVAGWGVDGAQAVQRSVMSSDTIDKRDHIVGSPPLFDASETIELYARLELRAVP